MFFWCTTSTLLESLSATTLKATVFIKTCPISHLNIVCVQNDASGTKTSCSLWFLRKKFSIFRLPLNQITIRNVNQVEHNSNAWLVFIFLGLFRHTVTAYPFIHTAFLVISKQSLGVLIQQAGNNYQLPGSPTGSNRLLPYSDALSQKRTFVLHSACDRHHKRENTKLASIKLRTVFTDDSSRGCGGKITSQSGYLTYPFKILVAYLWGYPFPRLGKAPFCMNCFAVFY